MMLADILRSSFAVAHRRPGLIVLDIFWKFLWFIFTLVTLLTTALWFTSGLRGISWENTGSRALNALLAAALLRDFWNANRGEVVLLAGFVLCASVTAWFVLEATFRRWLLNAGVKPAATFHILLLSNIAKALLLAAASLLFIPAALAGAITIAIVSFLAFLFFLTLLDTLIRADAVDLLGTDLIRVAGLLGILMFLEGSVTASFAAILITGFLSVARATDAVLVLGATVVVGVILNVLHSYLLLVRYSAIAIMRENVGEV